MTINFSQSTNTPFLNTAMVKIDDNIELCVETGGNPSNPALLLIMGLGCQMIFWPDTFVKKLIDAGFYVIRFDNRDVGLSSKIKTKTNHRPNPWLMLGRFTLGLNNPKDLVPYTLHDMAEDTVKLLDKLAIDKTNIIGASMGGMIAQLIAAKHPSRVLNLGLLFTSNNRAALPPAYPKQLKAMFGNPDGYDEASIIMHTAKMHQAIGSPNLVDRDYALDIAKRGYKRQFYPRGFFQQANAILSTGSLVKYDKKITANTIVVHGTKDRLLQPAHGKSVARNIKNAQFYPVKGMGHDILPCFEDELVSAFTVVFSKNEQVI